MFEMLFAAACGLAVGWLLPVPGWFTALVARFNEWRDS